jgi:hypothetical protein
MAPSVRRKFTTPCTAFVNGFLYDFPFGFAQFFGILFHHIGQAHED